MTELPALSQTSVDSCVLTPREAPLRGRLDVATDCFSTLQFNVNGQLSNLTNISIAAGSESACTSPGFTTAQLARLDQGDDFKMGSLTLVAGTDTSGSTTIRTDTEHTVRATCSTTDAGSLAVSPLSFIMV
jgi:hypothetical protein